MVGKEIIQFKYTGNKLTLSKVASIENLKGAYSIVSNKPTTNAQCFKKIKYKGNQLFQLQQSLLNHSYKPSPTKFRAIPKYNGGMHQIAIGSFQDSIVQAAIFIKLSPLVESVSSKASYGFRSNKGCHDALKSLKQTWPSCSWVMTFHIKEYFKTINQKCLLNFLADYCDQGILELIQKILAAKLVFIGHLNDNLDKESIEFIQSSMLSSLFCNIYINKLDKYIVHIQKVGIRKLCISKENSRHIIYDKHSHSGNLNALNNKVHLCYIRYGDDFLIGFNGTKTQACLVQKNVYYFLKNELQFEISKEKSKLHCGSDKNIFFLGIYIRWSKQYTYKNKSLDFYKINLVPTIRSSVTFRVPVEKLLQRAVDRGFGKKRKCNHRPRPTSYRQWVSLDNKVIIIKFSFIIRGLYRYYTCVNSRSDLWPIFDFYRKSCALTLSDKHRLKTAAKAFKRFGPNLIFNGKHNKSSYQLFYPKTLRTNVVFKEAAIARNLKAIDNFVIGVSDYSCFNFVRQKFCIYPGCFKKEEVSEYPFQLLVGLEIFFPFLKKLKVIKKTKVILCDKHWVLIKKKIRGCLLYKG